MDWEAEVLPLNYTRIVPGRDSEALSAAITLRQQRLLSYIDDTTLCV